MKKILALLFLIISSITVDASEPLKIGVMTDPHYLSEKLMDRGYAIQNYIRTSGKDVISTPEITDKLINEYLNSDIEVLLVCGDLTKDGEKESHTDFRDKLELLHKKGIKVFVIPGNHDINMPNSVRFQGNKTFKTDNISPTDFESIYADFGYAKALNRDKTSFSYLAELDDTKWLLAIDAARYEDYKDKPITAGRVKESTEQWIQKMLLKAKEEQKQVVAMMHWGAVEHVPMQASIFKDYLVDNYIQIADLLADNGVSLLFTGHFHSTDVAQYTTSSGNTIYDIETSSLVSYPFAYRFIELSENKAVITTKNVSTIPSNLNLADQNKIVLKQIANKTALQLLESKSLPFPDKYFPKMAEIASELFILHVKGDEIVDDSIKQELMDIFVDMGFPVDESMSNLELDTLPADNNLTIYFD